MLYPPRENLAFWGLLHGGTCGYTVVGETKKKGRNTYYRCTYQNGHCDGGYVRAEALDAQFRKLVRRVKNDDEIAERSTKQAAVVEGHQTTFHRSRNMQAHDFIRFCSLFWVRFTGYCCGKALIPSAYTTGKILVVRILVVDVGTGEIDRPGHTETFNIIP